MSAHHNVCRVTEAAQLGSRSALQPSRACQSLLLPQALQILLAQPLTVMSLYLDFKAEAILAPFCAVFVVISKRV